MHGLLRSVALVVLVFGLAGCGASEPPPAPAPTTPAPPPAADGTNVEACRDGACEIRVDGPVGIPVDERYGTQALQVTAVGGGAVTVTATMSRSSTIYSDCPVGDCASASVRSKATGPDDPQVVEVRAPAGYIVRFPALTMTSSAVVGSSAVLRLAHPEAVHGSDLAACRDGDCAVAVPGPVTIPLDPQLGAGGELRVTAVLPEALRVEFTVPVGSDLRVSCGGDDLARCPTTARGGRVQSTVLLGGQITLPKLRIVPAAIDGGSAVLRLRPP
ncbi:hypothetical protein ACQEVB_33095 [Pseudonocardia sp. CA-107938]|uniref:hypothetical protein n=1 Tax=Pseudonocardia sp. CA-107938 TaxID=3240021 RepID=UPI003D8E18E4